MPLYGGLPVKLRTLVGPPVDYDPDECTPEQLRDLCRDAIRAMIRDHQKRPGSVLRALRERVCVDCVSGGAGRIRRARERRRERRRRRRRRGGTGDHGGVEESSDDVAGVSGEDDEEEEEEEDVGRRENLHTE